MCSRSVLIFEGLAFCDVIQVVPVVQVTSGCPLVSSSGVCQLVVMPGLGHGGGISGGGHLGMKISDIHEDFYVQQSSVARLGGSGSL